MVKLNKIYTRTGDGGITGLVDGSRVGKADARIQAIGAVDEANCWIGFLVTNMEQSEHVPALFRIQNDLFDLGADLATPSENGDFRPSQIELRVTTSQIEWLEQQIDKLNQSLEPLSSFILPGGNEPAARAHIARAAVRSAERAVALLSQDEPTNPAALAYVNRLSDYLFVLGRVLNDKGSADIKWVPGENR
jgi:cob(I)alamin adenosyltransferase